MYEKLIAWTLCLFAVMPAAQAEREFLKPDQAFVISARAENDDKIRVNWEIAEGYYLYASKFRFLSDVPGIEFGDPQLPPALMKDDPIFGEVEIYRNQVSIGLPLVQLPQDTEMLTIRARSQGCADDGICYPPHTQTVLVALNQAVDAPPPVDPRRVDSFQPTGSDPGADDPLAALDAPVETAEPPVASIMPEEPAGRGAGNPLDELAVLGENLGLVDDDILSP